MNCAVLSREREENEEEEKRLTRMQPQRSHERHTEVAELAGHLEEMASAK